MWFESAWKKCLKSKNKELKKQDRRQLSRYHAADCAALRGEFEGWTIPEQIAFTGDFDRGPFETALLAAFNQMKNDNTFRGRNYFTTIVPKGWEDCIPLQAADLVAYENFKDSERRLTGRAKQRKPLQLLLANGSFGGRSRYFSPEAICQLRTLVEEGRKGTTHPVTS